MDRLFLYKILHIYGIVLLFAAVGGLTIAVANGATKASNPNRKLLAIAHGVAMLLILVGGFGMLARMGIVQGHGFPGWLWGKIAIWLVLGGVAALPYRKPELARPLFVILPLLAALAAYFAIYKPF